VLLARKYFELSALARGIMFLCRSAETKTKPLSMDFKKSSDVIQNATAYLKSQPQNLRRFLPQ
jgi:hypothetical protein